MSPVNAYLIGALGPLTLKTALYYSALRFRGVRPTLLSCILIASAGFLVFIPLPAVLAKLAAIALAVWLCQYYTEVEPVPDGLVIPLAVELFSLAVITWGLPPIIQGAA